MPVTNEKAAHKPAGTVSEGSDWNRKPVMSDEDFDDDLDGEDDLDADEDDTAWDDEDEAEEEKEEEQFRESLDKSFPLSGGETDEDI